MKILWIVNTIFPYPAEKLKLKKTNFGGWLESLAEQISKHKEIELFISTVYNGKDIIKFNDGKIRYYLIPGAPAIKYNLQLENYWKEVHSEINPDLVHIHGTEYVHGLAFKNIFPNAKVITSIQGLVSAIAELYYANITFRDIFKNITFRDILKQDSIFSQKKKFEQRGKNEINLIKKSNAIIGRTDWDYANCKEINNDLVYYNCNENLRSNFYEENWNINKIEKHTIFCSQAGYPIKGLHYMLRALKILKDNYGDVKLKVAGPNIIDSSNIEAKIKMTGYAKYLLSIIKRYDLRSHIEFTGILSEAEMVNVLKKTNIFVSPSVIENSSNSLCEAMLMGVPCVASDVGGTSSILVHKKEGFLYPYTEPAMLAEYISQIFEDNELAIKFGNNARNTALLRHDRVKNCEKTLEIYKTMIEGKSEI